MADFSSAVLLAKWRLRQFSHNTAELNVNMKEGV
jgi:hypothetical protein